MLVSFLALEQAFAQDVLSRGEKKEWKKKMKVLGPAGLRGLVDENEGNKIKATNLEARVTNLEQEKGDLAQEIQDLKDALARKEAETKALAENPIKDTTHTDENLAVAENGNNQPKARTQKGVVFKVQIGSFKKVNITKYFDRHKNFSGDVDSDGTMKYTLGVFPSYWEADTFKKYLREMGVKGAWVVAYKDGKRARIKDVLEAQ